jgi:hypothetical protein
MFTHYVGHSREYVAMDHSLYIYASFSPFSCAFTPPISMQLEAPRGLWKKRPNADSNRFAISW